MNQFKNSKLFFWSIEFLVAATLIFMLDKISFIFSPIVTFVTTLFAPIFLALILFYLINPLVNWMEKKKIKRIVAIGIVFVVMILIVVILVLLAIPQLIKQINQLIVAVPSFVKTFETEFDKLASSNMLKSVDIESYMDKFDLSFSKISKTIVSGISNGFMPIVTSIAAIVMTIATAPMILFFMLKDGDKIAPKIKKMLPNNYGDEVLGLLSKMNATLSSYISGQAIECAFVATFTSIGYALVGIPYAFLFGCIAGLTNMIPYLGPYIGLLPAILVTVFQDPIKSVLACVVVIIVQQVDGNFVYPIVIGKKLSIHPLTIILLLLVAGNIAGLLGMILGIPIYAVCKTVFIYVYDIIKLNRSKKKEAQVDASKESPM